MDLQAVLEAGETIPVATDPHVVVQCLLQWLYELDGKGRRGWSLSMTCNDREGKGREVCDLLPVACNCNRAEPLLGYEHYEAIQSCMDLDEERDCARNLSLLVQQAPWWHM